MMHRHLRRAGLVSALLLSLLALLAAWLLTR